jgi:hypothetical protein
MTQLLFGMTVLFVMYVIYEVFKTVSQTEGAHPHEPEPEQRSAPIAVSAPAPIAQTVPAATEEESERGSQLRNPATGEVSVAPTNYRFAKKWIKDALVTEGLLDRVYKPNELDHVVSQKVKDALDKFKGLEKYQA